MSSTSLTEQIVLITGGGKNLGAALARRFAEQGVAGLALHYHSAASRAEAEQTAAEIQQRGTPVLLVQADLRQPAAIAELFSQTKLKFGRIDSAINTVGMVLKKPILEISEAEFDAMLAINTKSAFFFLQQAGHYLADGGKICSLTTSLLGAFTGYYSSYAGAKAAVEHYTRAAAKEFAARRISVTSVAPGPMDTPFFYAQESAEAVAYLSKAAALSPYTASGLTEVRDIVSLINYLITDGWWMTGQTLLANGGFTTK